MGKRLAGEASKGLPGLAGSRAHGLFGILVYHRVAARVPGLPEPPWNVRPQRFREQLSGLKERGFTIWPLRTILQWRPGGNPIPPKTVVVTFDDGFESVHAAAWPVLRGLRVPATVFLSTAYLNHKEPFPFDRWAVAYRDRIPPATYRPLSSQQCLQMSRDGLVTLGSHTHTHDDFRGRPEEFRRDLETSLAILQTRFRQRRPPFAFPYGRRCSGHVSDELVAAAKQTDVACGLTTECELADPAGDRFQWGRFNVYDFDTGATLAAKLEGWYGWAPKLPEYVSGKLSRQA